MSRATDRCSGDPSCINRLVDRPSLDFFGAAQTAQATPLEATRPNVSDRGPIIVATCYNALLQPVRSVIDVRGCVSEPANLNGQLVCERGGGGGSDSDAGIRITEPVNLIAFVLSDHIKLYNGRPGLRSRSQGQADVLVRI